MVELFGCVTICMHIWRVLPSVMWVYWHMFFFNLHLTLDALGMPLGFMFHTYVLLFGTVTFVWVRVS